MHKGEIINVIKYSGHNHDIREEVNRIQDTLSAIPKDADLGAMESVKVFKEHNGFGAFSVQDRESGLISDQKAEQERITNDLSSIRIEVTSWIKDNPLVVKCNVLTEANRKSMTFRKCFIAILILIASAAIVLTVLQYKTDLIGDDAPIGEVVGLVDLVLGIFGFIYEIWDDAKQNKICDAVKEISASESKHSLDDNSKILAKEIKNNFFLSLVTFGHPNIVQQIITNGEESSSNNNREDE